ncbi:attacin-C-like [Lucilia cuprina]|uniref:attacin-C-like n=1 Tax=Lucilia cuprina TaxID=7375 RepID=UPI001F05573E|nr:attacin-C-like [Lucilia cuprina]
MKSFILTIVSVALLGVLTEAYPQRVYYQKLPYYPPPTQPPRPIRVRRDLGGQISTNPAGGNNAKVDFTQGIGTPEHNLIGQAFVS